MILQINNVCKSYGTDVILENINLTATRRALAKGEFDVFHSTYSKPYLPKYTRGKPYVITVQDLTHEKFPELPTAAREAAEEKLSIKYADRIITPSRSTADDLISLYPEAAEKVRVILDGVRVPQKLEAVPGLPEKFITDVFNAIHEASVEAQNEIISGKSSK